MKTKNYLEVLFNLDWLSKIKKRSSKSVPIWYGVVNYGRWWN